MKTQCRIKGGISQGTYPYQAPKYMIELRRKEASRLSGRDEKREMGQFFTPEALASFMASLVDLNGFETLRVLDAGAGIGNLTYALAQRVLRKNEKPRKFFVHAYEVDEKCMPSLSKTFAELQMQCQKKGVSFVSASLNKDFIADAVAAYEVTGRHQGSYDVCVLNPPYRKLNSNSLHASLLRKIGVKANNLYVAFFTLAAEQLRPEGQIVAVLPRSFCNGPLFSDFREFISKHLCLKRIHVIDARNAAFEDENVLQETIILVASKSTRQGGISISSTPGLDFRKVPVKRVSSQKVFLPNDCEKVIHVPVSTRQQQVWDEVSKYQQTLASLGLTVKTGPVVDFRTTKYFAPSDGANVVPLVYPHHFSRDGLVWPRAYKEKPNAIFDVPEVSKSIVPAGYYVVVKRFSAKEDEQRLVARVVGPHNLPSKKYAFENHVNYISAMGVGMDADLAFGVSAFLNGPLANVFFEVFSGHTQVNVADLRRLRFPDRQELILLGNRLRISQTDVWLETH